MKKNLLLGSILVGAMALAPSAMAQGIGGCELDGTANFASPLTAPASISTTYDFSGNLSNCKGSYSDTGGTVSAGQPIVIGGIHYAPLDHPVLSGGCLKSDTSGKSFIDWGNGKYSVIDYGTTGALAAVLLTGTFEKGPVTLTSTDINPATGHLYPPRSVNLAYGGDYTGGPLAFEPDSPTDCQTGVHSAGIQGFIGHGNYS